MRGQSTSQDLYHAICSNESRLANFIKDSTKFQRSQTVGGSNIDENKFQGVHCDSTVLIFGGVNYVLLESGGDFLRVAGPM